MNPIRIAIVGFGKIARDQHVPAIAASGASDVDLTPLRLVADAFMRGRRRIVEVLAD